MVCSWNPCIPVTSLMAAAPAALWLPLCCLSTGLHFPQEGSDCKQVQPDQLPNPNLNLI